MHLVMVQTETDEYRVARKKLSDTLKPITKVKYFHGKIMPL